MRACSLTGWQPNKKRLFKPRLQTLIAPGHTEMCEALDRANLVLPCPNPTFTIPPEVAYTPFCRSWSGKASRKRLAFPADMPLRPVCGLKAGKVIFELGIYRWLGMAREPSDYTNLGVLFFFKRGRDLNPKSFPKSSKNNNQVSESAFFKLLIIGSMNL